MAEADTNRSSLYFSEESTWGETPSTPTMKELQRVSDTFAHQKLTQVPATIRTDRLNEDIIRVGEQASGGFNVELRAVQYDDLLAASLGAAAWTTATITRTDLSAATSDDSFNTVAGDFVAAGFVVGMWIRVRGFTGGGLTADNLDWRVLSVTTTKMVIDGNLVDDAAGESVTITGKMARSGVTLRSFLFEKRFNDISIYQQLLGQRVNTVAVEMRNRAIITAAFEFMGRQGLYTGSSVAGSSVAAASNPALDSSGGMAFLLEGGSPIAVPLFSLTLNINNNMGYQPAIANRFPIGIRFGTLEITGTIVSYFENATVANKFINHTATSYTLKLVDNNGKAVFFTVPRIFYAEGTTPVQGQNQDIFLTMPFRASYDATTNSGIQVDILSAT